MVNPDQDLGKNSEEREGYAEDKTTYGEGEGKVGYHYSLSKGNEGEVDPKK